MCPNIVECSAHGIQSECLECTSIIEECTTNFHPDCIPVHSDVRVQARRDGEKKGKFFLAPRCLGAPPPLKNNEKVFQIASF